MKTYKRMIAIVIALAILLCIGTTVFASADEIGGEAAVTDSPTAVLDSDMDTDDIAAPIEESTSPPAKGTASNIPFFTGAILAVLAFAGVAVFCKVKGNK